MTQPFEVGAAPRVTADIHARDIPQSVRLQTVFATLDGLAAGEAIRLHVDHDPKPLFYMVQGERPGLFDWSPEQSGPTEWIVRIARRRELEA